MEPPPRPEGPLVATVRWRRAARRAAPWLVTLVVVAVLLGRYSLDAVVSELSRPGAFAVLPILFVTSLLSLVVLAISDRVVLAAVFGRLTRRDLGRARAGSAMLAGLHQGVSTSGMGLWLVRTTDCDPWTGVGAMVYLVALDLAAACLIALVTSALGGADILAETAPVALAIAGAAVLLVVGAGLCGRHLVAGARLGQWLRDPRLSSPWARVPPRAFLLGLAFRLANVGTWIVGTWMAASAFGLDLPLDVMAANLPLVAIVAALPMSVGGLGAAQLAWVESFDGWASGESILAFQFVLHWSATVALIARGLPFVRRVLGEIGDGRRVQ